MNRIRWNWQFGMSLSVLFLVLLGLWGCRPSQITPARATEAPTVPMATLPIVTAAALAAGGTKGGGAASEAFLFDDFAYASKEDMAKNGWKLRDAPGWPGVPGALWSADHIELVPDPDRPGGQLVQMTASTDGTPANTRQAQICQRRKFFEGTYASRVRFTDEPQSGPGGDQLVETFYQIAPQNGNLDPEYSELDFEYLPNGGWGQKSATLFVTSWETFQLEPWQAFNASDRTEASMDGWHTLVLQVAGGEVKYYLDGRLIGTHGGKNYPNVPMAMSYNLWFINGGLAPAGEMRVYQEWIDWSFYVPGVVLSPEAVEQRVKSLREAGVTFNDTVPENDPPLDSPCNF